MNQESSEALKRLIGDQPVVLLDVDDTITDTQGAHALAALAARKILVPVIGAEATDATIERFVGIFKALLGAHQSSSNAADEATLLAQRVEAKQGNVKRDWGAVKKFSREVLLCMALEDSQIVPTPELVNGSVDKYWRAMSSIVEIFPDAMRLCQQLTRLNVPVYLVTGSDGRMSLQEDGQFNYDPTTSHRDKEDRLRILRRRGVPFKRCFIGDPYDKPSERFYDGVRSGISVDINGDYSRVVSIGDSLNSDIVGALDQALARAGILYQRDRSQNLSLPENVILVSSLDEVASAIEP